MTIGIDLDQILAEIKRIQRDMQQLPAASEVAVSEGGVSEATADFRYAVKRVADGMGKATQNSIVALNDANEAMRLAVMAIAEQDAAIADEAKLILSLLDSAVEQAPTTPQPTPAGAQTSETSTDEPEEMDY
ncbi:MULTISPECIES: hypothetical protein [Microbacterium]|uniref:hypothetical protein n=1 Tax=Microbacterium TaxID=33882 RepID=UPI001656AB6A|nr:MULTISPECIES: hypothetical protein [Microbacterium]MCT1364202.1 hypothetical protein [Microbacterium sp. p3-SID131]MCT1375739.1 hypothetical protein [Microbacterium sp. p3-SID337]MCZ0711244.1 hypothetical protein [Microbacterium paraoxydans]CAD5137921.1 conserved protein of unknown function [Microbacterium sp. Nx66]